MPRATDIMPITAFTRAYQKVVKDLKKHKRPTVLTVDGRPSVVIQDAHAYEEMINALDALYVDEAVGRAMDDPRPSISVDELREHFGLLKKRSTRTVGRKRKAA